MNSLRPLASPRLALPLLGRAVFSAPSVETAMTAAAIGVRYRSKAAKPRMREEGKAEREAAKARRPAPEGHGERFWVFNHISNDMIVYSMTPEIRQNKAFRQFKFTGKKLVPSKIRKDYWQHLAVVEFAPGLGDVGRSVFQKLRELKHRHELEWQDESLLNMSKRERGKALNDQRGNVVADIAAVLAGQGKGNKMVVRVPRERRLTEEEKEGEEGKEGEKKKELYGATVYWANEQDKFYAESWSDNVTHVVGIPEKPKKVVEEAAEAEAEPAEEGEKAVEAQ